MKKLLFFLSFFVLSIIGKSQSIDTVIHTDIYTSYYNYGLHEPLYVSYKLYKGGGDCSRSGMVFKTNGLPSSATAKDYAHNGYDEGHLANAEDFASDCDQEKQTFFFFNCVPQTARLNRGIWKTYETSIRKLSQSDSLHVICGSIFGTKTIGPGKIGVPDFCWKIVYSLSTGKLIECVIFPNDNSDHVEPISVSDLQKMLTYRLIL